MVSKVETLLNEQTKIYLYLMLPKLIFLEYIRIVFKKVHLYSIGSLTSAPPVAERFYAQNWLTEGASFNPRSRLLTQPFGVFHGFHRNSRKYGLGSFRKIPRGRHCTRRPRSHKRTIGLNLTNLPNPTLCCLCNYTRYELILAKYCTKINYIIPNLTKNQHQIGNISNKMLTQ